MKARLTVKEYFINFISIVQLLRLLGLEKVITCIFKINIYRL